MPHLVKRETQKQWVFLGWKYAAPLNRCLSELASDRRHLTQEREEHASAKRVLYTFNAKRRLLRAASIQNFLDQPTHVIYK